ncbi:MAG: hypothetical protein KDH97_17705 [Calditrichaeota bacterium]|nr:hypothetical protein [Calditrichota bacterium]
MEAQLTELKKLANAAVIYLHRSDAPSKIRLAELVERYEATEFREKSLPAEIHLPLR